MVTGPARASYIGENRESMAIVAKHRLDVAQQIGNTEVENACQENEILVAGGLDVSNGSVVVPQSKRIARELEIDAFAVLEVLMERADGENGVAHCRSEVAELHDEVRPEVRVLWPRQGRTDHAREVLECSALQLIVSNQLVWTVPGQAPFVGEPLVNQLIPGTFAAGVGASGAGRLGLVTLDLALPGDSCELSVFSARPGPRTCTSGIPS